ncbi:MAG: YegS/Rv2252/BmrU family lipid kinase [Lachnospiraceae bacterium]|nr:YegS/Rv2252/BmrU family lipid kinase [Lachnospiraceae bacterium]
MKKLIFVYNPKAGKGKVEEQRDIITRTFVKNGFDVDIHATTCKGDAHDFLTAYLAGVKKCLNQLESQCADAQGAADAEEKKEMRASIMPARIVVAGGDGTLQEVMQAVVESGLDIPVGILPTGSTNDFGYSLKLSKDIRKNAEIASSGRGFKCDVATFNGQYFVYTAAFGLFSEVSYATSQKLKNTLGHFAYLAQGAATLYKTKKIHAKVMMDSEIIEDDFLLGMVVSAKSVGGFRGITGKGVKLNDGLHEVMLVRWPKNPIELAKALKEVLTHKRNGKYFKMVSAKNICFEFDRPIKWSVDGEYGGKRKAAKIRVEKQRIKYIVP